MGNALQTCLNGNTSNDNQPIVLTIDPALGAKLDAALATVSSDDHHQTANELAKELAPAVASGMVEVLQKTVNSIIEERTVPAPQLQHAPSDQPAGPRPAPSPVRPAPQIEPEGDKMHDNLGDPAGTYGGRPVLSASQSLQDYDAGVGGEQAAEELADQLELEDVGLDAVGLDGMGLDGMGLDDEKLYDDVEEEADPIEEIEEIKNQGVGHLAPIAEEISKSSAEGST